MASGDYARAENEARQLVADAGSASDKAAVIRATSLLVEALVRNGRGVEASTRTLAEAVLKSLESDSGSGGAAISPALRLLGDVLVEAGDYPGAAARFRQAFETVQRAGGEKSLEAAWDLDGLARALTRVEQFDQALQASNDALALKREALGSDDVDVAQTLDIRAQVWQHKGEYRSRHGRTWSSHSPSGRANSKATRKRLRRSRSSDASAGTRVTCSERVSSRAGLSPWRNRRCDPIIPASVLT